jgi:antitoxin (DNA-binding transcriptional repressor) of toxin-antitoxin stability system
MSRTVSVSDLKSRLSEYLRAVRDGEVLLVRDRDRIVARIEVAGPTMAEPDEERVARLERAGVLRRRRRALDVGLLLRRRVQVTADVVGALIAERDEGR